MSPGDTLRFHGPSGAQFVVTVGPAFSVEYIETQVRTGEWTPIFEPEPESKREPAVDKSKAAPRRPSRSKSTPK